MSDYKIEKNIEVKTIKPKYPFREMKVGDSFLFPLAKLPAASTAAYDFGKRNDMKFTCCKVSETQGRIWKIK